MKYHKLISLLFIATIGCLFTSCEETAEVDEFANWESRNTVFIDSIARVAQANADGKWLRILSYKLDSVNINGNLVNYDAANYVYCHIEQEGIGTKHPVSTVLANYRGRLIPTSSHPQGKVFDESYRGELNPATNKPIEFSLDNVIVGWTTALMHMVEGDYWRLYIPANLGYGSTESTDIPAHSALIFDINLAKVIN